MKTIKITIATLGVLTGLVVGSASATPLSSYQTAVLAEPSLISYYEFDNGTPNDYGPGGNNGVLQGTAGYANGLAGGPDLALNLDGSGALDELGPVPAFDFTSGNGTVECWLRKASTALQTVFANRDIGGTRWDILVSDTQIAFWNGAAAQFVNLPTSASTTWHHLAVVFNGGNWTAVWDGQSLATSALGLGSLGHPVQLGNGFSGDSEGWNGELDEVAFYSAALPLLTIQQHYKDYAGALAPVITVQPLSGSGVLGKGFNLSVAVSGSNPDYQWYQNSVPLAGQTNADLPVATSLVATNAGTYSCVITNAGGSVTSSNAVLMVYSNLSPGMASYESAVLAEPSLISYYTFDDRTARDDFGTNEGALVGTATYGPSFQVPGSALSLDGGGYDQLGVVPAFDFASGSGTVELWVQASAATLANNNYPTIIANGDASGRDWSVHVPPGAGYLVFGPFNYQAQLPTVLDTNWHHLALIFDGGASTLTVVWDGKTLNNWSDGTTGSHSWPQMGFQGFGHPVQLGTWNGLNFGGNLDEVAFYGATLPLSDIQAHYAAAQSGPPTVSNPSNLEIYQGLNATFSSVTAGYPVPTVQWYQNGNLIAGATNQTLIVSNILNNQSGYTIAASNSYGSVTSSPAMFTVVPVTCSYASAVLAENPMGYWRFSDGGGTNAYDYAGGNDAFDTNYVNNSVNGGTGNPATLGAGPQPPAFPGFEPTNTAPFLDGLSQGFSSSVGLFNNRSNFTIMGWFNINPTNYPIPGADGSQPFTHPQGRASLFGQEWAAELGIYQGTNLYFYATGISATIFSSTNLTPGVWNFVAAVSDATANTTTLYLNGAVVGAASACPGTVNSYLMSMGKNVSYFPSGGYDNAFFPGSLDEVAAFDHPLSASQIQAFYQTGAGTSAMAPTNVVARVSNLGGNNNVIITGTGGSSSSGYTVLTTTNITTPLTNWTTLASGLPFGTGGAINYTNPINPATPSLFYRIRVP